MSGELIDRVKDEIARSGFPLELRTGAQFASAGFDVRHSSYYIDRDENKGREIDIVAQSYAEMGDRGMLGITCVVECKKSVHPWVAFSTPRAPWMTAFGLVHNRRGLPTLKHSPTSTLALARAFHFHDAKRVGRSFMETHSKGMDGSGPFYSAIMSVCKAASHEIDQSRPDGEYVLGDQPDLQLYLPTVVVEGRLFEAWLDGGVLQTEEREHIVVEQNYMSAKYRRSGAVVDVVTESGLPSHIETIKATWKRVQQTVRLDIDHFFPRK